MLGKLPVPGVLLTWIIVGQGPIALVVGAGWGCLDIFSLILFIIFFSFIFLYNMYLFYCSTIVFTLHFFLRLNRLNIAMGTLTTPPPWSGRSPVGIMLAFKLTPPSKKKQSEKKNVVEISEANGQQCQSR